MASPLYTPSMIPTGPLLIEIDFPLAKHWAEFSLNDVALLACPEHWNNQSAVFIASLNSKNEVASMLETCGFYIIKKQTLAFVFRTSHATVLTWAKRFGARQFTKENHRPRFYMDGDCSPEWFRLCSRAYYRKLWRSVNSL